MHPFNYVFYGVKPTDLFDSRGVLVLDMTGTVEK